MPLLVDGHNLIGRMPDMSLADADDEAELVRRLRRYCQRNRRRATVVFDRGLPGGVSPALSAPPVEVVFAAAGESADRVLMRRIRRARDPRGLLVVSSDRMVQEAARAQGARVIASEEFAAQLVGRLAGQGEPDKPTTVGNVDEWLRAFGG